MAVVRLGNKDVELAGAEEGLGGFEGGGFGGGFGGPCPMPFGASGLVPNYVAGITAPQYGMPYVGTPIGLPGPPHVPFGGPAGLQKHVMKNHTHMSIPGPTQNVKIHVRQQPGQSYPKPANRAWINEQMIHPSLPFEQPHWDMHEGLRGGVPAPVQGGAIHGRHGAGGMPAGYCPPEEMGH